MRQLKLFVLAAAAALFAAACATNTTTNTATGPGSTVTVNANSAPAASPAAAGSPDELAAARATFNTTCAKCHKENGEGGVRELDEGTKITVPSFREAHSIEHTDADFVRKITNGDKEEGMPAFKGRLTPEQINELVRYIRREFQSGGAKAAASNANAGAH